VRLLHTYGCYESYRFAKCATATDHDAYSDAERTGGLLNGSSRLPCRPIAITLCSVALALPLSVHATNPAAAEDLAQASGCFKCHTVAKKKDGPAYRDVAAKYRDIADAEEKLIYHITRGEMVKFDDGHEEHHKKVKARSADEARNLVRWILAQEGGTKY